MGKIKKSFTMAEILISLTIIGVIAALTLPALQANINEKTWATQRKALYSRMSQAISMLPSLNGYGEYAGTWNNNNVNVSKDTAAQAFVTNGLAKVLNISNICTIPANTTIENAQNEFKKCGIPNKITTMANTKIDFPTKLSKLNGYFIREAVPYYNRTKFVDTVAAAFTTDNGESIAVFYNPFCQPDDFIDNFHLTTEEMCANFIFDLNGRKGPNKFGKDIGFITALFPTDSEIVAPVLLNKNATPADSSHAAAACRTQDKDSRLPNRFEAMAMAYNFRFAGNIRTGTSSVEDYTFWTSTIKNNKRYLQYTTSLLGYYESGSGWVVNVRCVKR